MNRGIGTPGQSTVEYLLGLTTVLLALLYAARPGGPLQGGLKAILDGVQDHMRTSVDEAKSRYR